jgi:hypothetical protein
VDHASLEALQRSLDAIRRSPRATGTVELIVRRPAVDEREPLEAAELDPVEGLVGDTWRQRPSSRTPDRSPHPDMQLTLMNARAAAAIAGARERWPLAGDQLYVDLDERRADGEALVEVTDQPHTGCGKFARRFGVDAVKFVNSREGRALNLRGVNARVVERGAVRTGDAIRVA